MTLGLLDKRSREVTWRVWSSVHRTSSVNSTEHSGQKSSQVQSCRGIQVSKLHSYNLEQTLPGHWYNIPLLYIIFFYKTLFGNMVNMNKKTLEDPLPVSNICSGIENPMQSSQANLSDWTVWKEEVVVGIIQCSGYFVVFRQNCVCIYCGNGKMQWNNDTKKCKDTFWALKDKKQEANIDERNQRRT